MSRWRDLPLPAPLLIVVLIMACALGPLRAALPAPIARGVGPIAITVSDLDRSVDFYTRVLNFRTVARTAATGEAYARLEGLPGLRTRTAVLALGQERIALVEYVTPKGRPFPVDSHGNDVWFEHLAIVTSNMDRAYARLQARHVRNASRAPQRLPDWNPEAGGIRAYYFRDPDGHYLELLQFPPGKGAARWHASNAPLFLGIDHTAIVVRDTKSSLGFYRDQLGLRVAAQSDNYGIEQERLSGVGGAHVRITSLRARTGPGIELLEYVAPIDGRPIPVDERANDLAYWQTSIDASDVAGAAAWLRHGGASFISSESVTLPGDPPVRAAVVRDPDGHALELIGS